MYSLQELNEAYINYKKENYSSNSELVGTLLGFSFAIFIIVVLLTVGILLWSIIALLQNRKRLDNWGISLSILCIMSVFVPGIGLFGPIFALLFIYSTRKD